jgi:hypothetical protein
LIDYGNYFIEDTVWQQVAQARPMAQRPVALETGSAINPESMNIATFREIRRIFRQR